jgi:hypothetical protein
VFQHKVCIPCGDDSIDHLRNLADWFVGAEFVAWESEWTDDGCVEFRFRDPENCKLFERIKMNRRDLKGT